MLGLYGLALTGIGMAAGGLAGASTAAPVVATVAIGTFLLDTLAPILHLPDWVSQLALTTHRALVPVHRRDRARRPGDRRLHRGRQGRRRARAHLPGGPHGRQRGRGGPPMLVGTCLGVPLPLLVLAIAVGPACYPAPFPIPGCPQGFYLALAAVALVAVPVIEVAGYVAGRLVRWAVLDATGEESERPAR